METNYVIGGTYYYKGRKLILKRFEDDKDCNYPLRCFDFNGEEMSFTLNGKLYTCDAPSLSTSPTEFIAPKEKCERPTSNTSFHDCIFKAYHLQSEYDKMIKIEQAIKFLKKEGYTITKQY